MIFVPDLSAHTVLHPLLGLYLLPTPPLRTSATRPNRDDVVGRTLCCTMMVKRTTAEDRRLRSYTQTKDPEGFGIPRENPGTEACVYGRSWLGGRHLEGWEKTLLNPRSQRAASEPTLCFTLSNESGVSTENPIRMTCAFEYAKGRNRS